MTSSGADGVHRYHGITRDTFLCNSSHVTLPDNEGHKYIYFFDLTNQSTVWLTHDTQLHEFTGQRSPGLSQDVKVSAPFASFPLQ